MAISAETIQFGPWNSGVWYSRTPEDCPPDGLTLMTNMRIGSSGEVKTRPGNASYLSQSALAGTPTITAHGQFDVDASQEEEFLIAGAAIYKYSSGWSDITGATTITAGDDNTFQWVNANGTLILTNGVDTDALKWTGTGNAAALDDNGRFTKGNHIAWFDNRLWIGNVNGATGQLWYSDIGDIETWGATSFYNFGSPITGLQPTQNALTVHTEDGIFTMISTGSATLPYQRQQRTTRAGLGGRSIIPLTGSEQLFVQTDGIYRWAGGADVEKISYQLDGVGYWNTINTARLKHSHGVYYPKENEVWFALPYGAAQTNMNHIMVYNTRFNCWSGPWSGFTRNTSALIDNKPHMGGFDGLLYDMDTGTSDNGTAISWDFETAATPPMGSDVRLRWLYARTFVDAAGDYSCTVTQDSSGLTGTTESLNLLTDTFTLGTSVLGVGTLGSLRMVAKETRLAGYDPHTSLKYSSSGLDQPATFRRTHLQFKPIGRKRRGTRT